MSDELKACPFCGSTEISTEMGLNLNYCDKCSAEANIEHWNTRPLEDALRAERDRAEAMCDEIASELSDLESAKGDLFDEATAIRVECDRAVQKQRDAEAMVERLIEAGERLSIHSRMVDDIDLWNALVAEWQAQDAS